FGDRRRERHDALWFGTDEDRTADLISDFTQARRISRSGRARGRNRNYQQSEQKPGQRTPRRSKAAQRLSRVKGPNELELKLLVQKEKLPPTQYACGSNGSFDVGAPARLAPSREERPARD